MTIDFPGSHLPDFLTVLNRTLTDKNLVGRKFRNAAGSYAANATVQRDITDIMLRKAAPANHILEIGAGTGHATSRLAGMGDTEVWDLAISPAVQSLADSGLVSVRTCDAETEIHKLPSGSIGLLFSASTMQWFNSPATFLREVERVLAPGGLALLSTFGPRTMEEIHGPLSTTPDFPDDTAIRMMIPEAEIEDGIMTLEFLTPAEALRHVRLTGVNSLGARFSPQMVRRLLREYPLSEDGKAPLTYQPIFITIRKPS